nr:hypothetical protein KPHV_85480 [Kitasatospora purpeofusca]
MLDELIAQRNDVNNRTALVALRLAGELIRSAHPTASTVILWEPDGSGLEVWSMHTSDDLELDEEVDEELGQAVKRLDGSNTEVWKALASASAADCPGWPFDVIALTAIRL